MEASFAQCAEVGSVRAYFVLNCLLFECMLPNADQSLFSSWFTKWLFAKDLDFSRIVLLFPSFQSEVVLCVVLPSGTPPPGVVPVGAPASWKVILFSLFGPVSQGSST